MTSAMALKEVADGGGQAAGWRVWVRAATWAAPSRPEEPPLMGADKKEAGTTSVHLFGGDGEGGPISLADRSTGIGSRNGRTVRIVVIGG